MEATRVSHYEITRRLGRGGMGEVWEAVDLDLGRRVALKFIAAELASEPESFRRFEREARLAAALSHPHIATLYAFERDAGRPFIAMELMSGQSLRARLAAGPLPVAEGLRIARDVASALAHAHSRDIIHRDIKPENLMFDLEGVAKVTDFGLAKATQAARVTMTGTSLGTAAYMAPESVRGELGKPADVFALGVMLHEMLAGALPFKGDSPLALLYSIANSEPESLRARRPDAPEAVESLLARMLAKDPGARPDAAAAARELAQLSGEALSEAELRSLEPPPATHATEEVEVERVPGRELAPRAGGELVAKPRRKWYAHTIPRAAVFALAALAVVRVFWHPGDPRRGPAFDRARAEATALNNRGIAAFQKDSLDAARIYFEAALVQDPDNAQALNNIGMVFLRQGDDPHATLHFTQVAQRRLGDAAVQAVAHYNLGDIDLRAGAWSSAADEFRLAAGLDSDSPAYWNNLGYALIRADRAAEARAVLDSALARFPTMAALHKNAALAAFQMGENQRALTELDRAIQLDRGFAPARGLRARVRAAAGNRAGALEDWNAYLALAPDPQERTEVEGELRERGVLARR